MLQLVALSLFNSSTCCCRCIWGMLLLLLWTGLGFSKCWRIATTSIGQYHSEGCNNRYVGLACLFATYFASLFVFPCPCLTPFPWCCVRGRRPPAVGGVWWPWRESPEVVLWSGLVMLLWSLQIMLWGSFKAWVLVTLLFLWTLNINKKSNPVHFVFIQMQTHTCLAFVV